MKLPLSALLLLAAVAAPPPEAKQAADARALVGEFAKTLKAELVRAMKAGGPVQAITVCNSVAPGMAAAISSRVGAEVGRTSLRLRNPANAPDAWERKVLEDFERRLAAGADPKTLEHAETTKVDGRPAFRFMKAIPVGKPCLTCHGESLAPEVKAELAKRYPADQATGFKLGDLRGAFTVVRPLP